MYNIISEQHEEIELRGNTNLPPLLSWCVLPDNRVVITGGSFDYSPQSALPNAYIYDHQRNELMEIAPMLKPRVYHSIVIWNDSVVVVGGSDETGALNDCEILDMPTMSWKPFATLNEMRTYAGVFSNQYHIFVAGGVGTHGPRDSIEIYFEEDHQFFLYERCKLPRKMICNLAIVGEIAVMFDKEKKQIHFHKMTDGTPAEKSVTFPLLTKWSNGNIVVNRNIVYAMIPDSTGRKLVKMELAF
jgi:hypothetical protein